MMNGRKMAPAQGAVSLEYFCIVQGVVTLMPETAAVPFAFKLSMSNGRVRAFAS